jgi:signal transduction histidine kinase
MNTEFALLILLAVMFAVIIVILRTKLIVTKRISDSLWKGVRKERNATADILRLSRKVIASQGKEKEFLPYFIKYTVRSLKASGGAIMLSGEDDHFYGCAVSGTFPPLKEVSPLIEAQLLSNDKKHTEFFRGCKIRFTADELDIICGTRGFAFFNHDTPNSFPENFVKDAPYSLMAPIKLDDKIYGCIVVCSKNDFDSHPLSRNDGVYLIRLAEIASLCLEVVKASKQRQEYVKQLQNAREEGMTQVSSGIIHNIGNAITIAKLAVNGLINNFNIKPEDKPENLMLKTVVPRMEKELAEGNLENFLKNDPQGKEYFSIIKELLEHIETTNNESAKMLKSLSDKLFHISEILELQQRFVGELGTENMTNLEEIINSSVTIFEESFNKRGYKIETDISKAIPEVLVDASMLTQVIINFIKNAVEAMEAEKDSSKEYALKVGLQKRKRESKDFAVITISDNGPGIPTEFKDKIFEFGFSTKMDSNSSKRGIGLHFCSDCIRKYGGSIEVDSKSSEGTSFKIFIPITNKF